MDRYRVFALFLLTVAMLVLLSDLLTVPTVRSEGFYRVPIIVIERSGNDLYNYTIEVVLNSTNFDGWDRVSENGSDIYFTDSAGAPLYYWIEYFSKVERRATIWVKVPHIPANGATTIYMHYGGGNPFASYNDPTQAFLEYATFDHGYQGWIYGGGSGYRAELDASEGNPPPSVHIYGDDFDADAYIYKVISKPTSCGIVLEVDYRAKSDYSGSTVTNAHLWIYTADGATQLYSKTFVAGGTTDTGWRHEQVVVLTEVRGYDKLQIRLGLKDGWKANWNQQNWYDNIRIRLYIEPEPKIVIGKTVVETIRLPSRTLIYVHDLVYSPSATQFSYAFTASNESYASYDVGYSDRYGFRVVAFPAEGVENNATLVAEVTVALPYESIYVDSLTLVARTNATGKLRQLWIRLLDSDGNVVAEVINASLGTDWTAITLPVATNLSGSVKIWINATVATTTSSGEEIDVKDVKLSARYVTNPAVYTSAIGREFIECRASFIVELGSEELLNASTISLKVIHYVKFDGTSYPVDAVYVGNETIGGETYAVYRIDDAVHGGVFEAYLRLPNALRDTRIVVNGVEVDRAVVGEELTIELPTVGNVTVPELNVSAINVTTLTLKLDRAGTYTIIANTTLVEEYKLGFFMKKIPVDYGRISVELRDAKGSVLDYEELVLELVDSHGKLVKRLEATGRINVTDLVADRYTLIAKLKNAVVGATVFDLNATTTGSTLVLNLSIERIRNDYRGLDRVIAWDYTKKLVAIESLSDEYPYSRMRILLNGTGDFALVIDYGGDPPTKVEVVGNVTDLRYWWNGTCLVVTGTLGSVGAINVSDLYRLRIELYDRLGNVLPSSLQPVVVINGTSYVGSVVEDYLCPASYIVEVPRFVHGFEFYGFWDGYNDTARVVAINHSDVVVRVWYRVPTHVEKLGGVRIAKPLSVPFVTQDSYVLVYVEGYLRDFYGNGVPNRPVMVRIIDVETGGAIGINTTTDASGYFRTRELALVPGKTYRVVVTFGGDDVYVATQCATEFKPEELPSEQPSPVPALGVEQALFIATVALLAVSVVASIKTALKHVVSDLARKRFVARGSA